MTFIPIQYIKNDCQNYSEKSYPDLSPTIIYLSDYYVNYLASSNTPYRIYIRGTNFNTNDITSITFGPYKNIPITFYSSTSISFIIPMNAKLGPYNIQVVNQNIKGLIYSNIVVLSIKI